MKKAEGPKAKREAARELHQATKAAIAKRNPRTALMTPNTGSIGQTRWR